MIQLLTRLKIGPRLLLGFAGVLALTLIVGLVAIQRLGQVNESTRDLAGNWLVAMRALGEYRDALSTIHRGEALHVMSASVVEWDAQEKRIADSQARAARQWARYTATVTEDAERLLVKEIEQGQAAYYRVVAQLVGSSRGGAAKAEEARSLYRQDSRKAFDDLMASLDKDIDYQTLGGDRAFAGSQQTYAQTRWAVAGLLAAAVAVGAALALLITRSITGPIARAVAVAETVAAGDLSSDVRSDARDETGQLLAALRTMNHRLASVVSQVRNSSDSIATGSAQIATGNADLSQRTEEQASNLQQTAASMEQLTATVKQNADTAQQANQLAASASGAAAEGGRVVEQVVATMDQISESSRRIGDIIGVIDGIAFQTNILALNAAVEAARAGEQGRGFAVVAAEVRSLAQRSATAAKEIKTLIGQSVEKVESGSRLVHSAVQSMGEIVARVKQVNDLIGEISEASAEQSSGIGQIGDAVNQLDQVTQQNAALVEQSAAAAESLKHQAAALAQTVALFKVGAVPAQDQITAAENM
ncbi:MAG: MCP four helix bundle domain-containing protein [Burkholderiaceae bacterium]|nr:MCP four helix bundle domain-containing protein [Burkholderiaceae bacterium]